MAAASRKPKMPNPRVMMQTELQQGFRWATARATMVAAGSGFAVGQANVSGEGSASAGGALPHVEFGQGDRHIVGHSDRVVAGEGRDEECHDRVADVFIRDQEPALAGLALVYENAV